MAEALTAFFDGDRGELGQAGALLLAEGLGNLRTCGEFANNYARALSRRGRK